MKSELVTTVDPCMPICTMRLPPRRLAGTLRLVPCWAPPARVMLGASQLL